MQTERFHKLRSGSLSKIFEKKPIVGVWKNIVKDRLRTLDLKDLYDHFDFNYKIEDRAAAIRSEILNGTYRVSPPLVYRIEKKLGICRHAVIPQPIDVLILQVLVENIADKLLAKQPSRNAFYAREKHNTQPPHTVEDYGLSWRQQWKELQKHIYEFNDEKELIVVTDLANYYDSIDIRELRKVLFSDVQNINEVVIDLLFKIIEEISWKPDYLPYSDRGLPTTNIEGVRLLAHAFLFEIDEVIKDKTKDSFTRWMDDIVIGADDRKEAIETISAVSDMLKSRGLALNLSKTNIYNADEGYYHFQIEMNRYIDLIEKVKTTDTNYKTTCTDLHKQFKKHLKDKRPKYWDKVAKRFITSYGKLQCRSLLNILPEVYVENPGLRPNLNIYLAGIGFQKGTSNVVLEILTKLDVFDDLSLYQLCELITQWEIPVSKLSKSFLTEFENKLTAFSFKNKSHSNFYCILWFKAKYSDPDNLLAHIVKYQNYWQSEPFLRRQVTAVLSRLLTINSTTVSTILFNQISSGLSNTVTLATQIFQFSKLPNLDKKLTPYLFLKNKKRPYSLNRFLVLCSVLNSIRIRSDKTVKAKVLAQINDPYYRKWLKLQYGIK